MKKISTLFMAGLLALCFSLSTAAQSSQQDLDQVELMKKFIGTWEAEWGEDTVIWECTPLEMGYEHVIHKKTKEGTFHYLKAIGGFTSDYKTCIWYELRPNGTITRDFGKFVSDKKMQWERFDDFHKNVTMKIEFTFQTPDRFHEILRWKSNDGSWDEANVFELVYTRVKK